MTEKEFTDLRGRDEPGPAAGLVNDLYSDSGCPGGGHTKLFRGSKRKVENPVGFPWPPIVHPYDDRKAILEVCDFDSCVERECSVGSCHPLMGIHLPIGGLAPHEFVSIVGSNPFQLWLTGGGSRVLGSELRDRAQ